MTDFRSLILISYGVELEKFGNLREPVLSEELFCSLSDVRHLRERLIHTGPAGADYERHVVHTSTLSKAHHGDLFSRARLMGSSKAMIRRMLRSGSSWCLIPVEHLG
jgi:hypothetical protein